MNKQKNPYEANPKATIFGSNLRKIRRQYKWSQDKMSDVIGINRSTIGAWEEGRSHPNAELLIHVADKLGINDIKAFMISPDFDLNKAKQNPGESVPLFQQKYYELVGPAKQAVDSLLGL